MTRLAAALSSFLQASLNWLRNSSTEPSRAVWKPFSSVLTPFLTVRLCRRRLAIFRKFFLALRVCGIDPLHDPPVRRRRCFDQRGIITNGGPAARRPAFQRGLSRHLPCGPSSTRKRTLTSYPPSWQRL